MERPSSDDEPFSALAFKIMSDPFVGTLTFTRIYSGILLSGSSVFNSVKVGLVRGLGGVLCACVCVSFFFWVLLLACAEKSSFFEDDCHLLWR